MEAGSWDRELFDAIVVINNAWRVRKDWTHLIHPEDFPEERRPKVRGAGQTVVTADDYVSVQNRFGGFLYAGGTMAFTAGYWALGALKPSQMGFIGCDMVYPKTGHTHFYGTGEADPLRADITLQDLEAKSARLFFHAALAKCACVNYSQASESRLVFPRSAPIDVQAIAAFDPTLCQCALAAEDALGYMVEDGRYWLQETRYDAEALARIDGLWNAAWAAYPDK